MMHIVVWMAAILNYGKFVNMTTTVLFYISSLLYASVYVNLKTSVIL